MGSWQCYFCSMGLWPLHDHCCTVYATLWSINGASTVIDQSLQQTFCTPWKHKGSTSYVFSSITLYHLTCIWFLGVFWNVPHLHTKSSTNNVATVTTRTTMATIMAGGVVMRTAEAMMSRVMADKVHPSHPFFFFFCIPSSWCTSTAPAPAPAPPQQPWWGPQHHHHHHHHHHHNNNGGTTSTTNITTSNTTTMTPPYPDLLSPQVHPCEFFPKTPSFK